MIFRKLKKLEIDRPAKYGGDIEFDSYEELERMYREGKIHPLDLKNAVAEALDELVKPIREHFEKDKKAKSLYETIKLSEVTK